MGNILDNLYIFKIEKNAKNINYTNALIYVNTTLFILLHSYKFQPSIGSAGTLRQLGQQNVCPD